MAGAWKQIRGTRIATHAALPTLSEATIFYTQDRKRLVIHNGTTWDELAKRTDYPIGTLIFNDFQIAASETFPAIARNVNQDLDIAYWPLAVPLYRAVKAVVPSGSTTDHSVTVSGSTVTFSGTAGDQLISLIAADALAAGWLNGGQAANFSALYSGAYQRCLNVAGVDYPIAGANLVAHTLTVTGTPTSGAQTAICYTYRIAGSTTTCRLRGIPGFVPVAAGDVDGEVVEGWMKMDRFESHQHGEQFYSAMAGGVYSSPSAFAAYQITLLNGVNTGSPVTDTVNLLRTGKTTDPRTIGQRAYTWLGQYVA